MSSLKTTSKGNKNKNDTTEVLSSKTILPPSDNNSKWWDIGTFNPEDNPHGVVCESSFASLFPKYREKYIREIWPLLAVAFEERKLKCDLDILEGTMIVRTSRKTWDPFVIFKARDVLRLLSRSVPFEQAVRVLEDETFCEIIKISSMATNRERFVKRRARLVGQDGATLKAIELLTKCYVMVQGATVSVIGSHQGLKEVRKIVEDCMHNVHPIYNIKTLMIKNELVKDERLRNENWDRFLPKFRKKVQTSKATRESKKSKKNKWKNKTEYTPFPPPQQPSKIDMQLETGEYFLNEQERRKQKMEKLEASQMERKMQRKRERAAELIAPSEASRVKHSKSNNSSEIDIQELKKKVSRGSARKGAK